MSKLNTILEELKDVPENRLDELHEYISTLMPAKPVDKSRIQEIMKFSDTFKDMSEQDFQAFVHETERLRQSLFDRNFDL